MKSNPKLEEVAKLAGVSSMTVSRVVNNSRKVSEKTKQKVLEAIKAVGYQPNVIARSLAKNKTNILGLVVYKHEGIHPEFHNEIINGVQAGASELGYDLLIFAHNDDESYSGRITQSSLVDGVVFMGISPNNQDLLSVHEKQFPYIFIGKREVEGVEPFFISPDYITGTEKVTGFLIERGHTRIGFIGQSRKIEPDRNKLLGYQKALFKHQITYNPALVFEESQSQSDGFRAMMELLAHRPTAVILNNTYTTLGAVTAIKEAGLRIPEDISVIGFDDNQELNQQFSDFIGIELTSLQIPKKKLGKEAAKLAISLIEGKEEPKENYLDLLFIQKNSCREIQSFTLNQG